MQSHRGSLIAVAAASALTIAACGGKHPSHAASTPYGPRNAPASMSRCMRAHGLSNFPDPSAAPGGGVGFPGGVVAEAGGKELTVDGMSFSGPVYVKAAAACKEFLPGGNGPPPSISAAQKAKMLAIAACVRRQGVPSFADPTFPPSGGIQQNPPPDFNPQSPAFQQAAKACGIQGGFGVGP